MLHSWSLRPIAFCEKRVSDECLLVRVYFSSVYREGNTFLSVFEVGFKTVPLAFDNSGSVLADPDKLNLIHVRRAGRVSGSS